MNASQQSSVISNKSAGFARSVAAVLGAVFQRITLDKAQKSSGSRRGATDLDGSELIRYDCRDLPSNLTCERGVLWVTQDGQGDILLNAGESYRPTAKGVVLVQALCPSRMSANFR